MSFLGSTSILILSLLLTSSTASSFRSVLPRKSKLSVEKRNQDVLVSPNKIFSCGFYQVDDNAFTFSIWFNGNNVTDSNYPSPSSRVDVVWSANRDRPVNGRRSRLSMQGNYLVLTDGLDDSIAWTASTVNRSTFNNGQASPRIAAHEAKEAELLDNGNLVLRDNMGNNRWQSFDFPTDTILAEQPFTRNTRLTSSASTDALSTGFYAFYFDNDNVLRIMYDGPDTTSIYWPDPEKMVWDNARTTYNSSRYAVLDRAGQFISSDDLKFNASDYDVPVDAVLRRLTLDPDGDLRLYSSYRNISVDNTSNVNSRWHVTWQAMMHKGKIHGVCGRNGFFTYKLKPTCSCPPGYRRANPSNWKDGCLPSFPTANKTIYYFCPTVGRNQSYKFLQVPHTDFYGSDVNFTKFLSFNDCKGICEQDCRCQGFVYRQTGEGNCYPKFALFNGYTTPDFISSLFLKFPRDFQVSSSHINYFSGPTTRDTEGLSCSVKATTSISNKRGIGTSDPAVFEVQHSRRSTSRFKWVYWNSFVAVFGFIEFLFIATGWWFLYWRGEPDNYSTVYSLEPSGQGSGYHYKQAITNNFRMFSYNELKRVTNNFSLLLGRGGSGEVYKGVLDDKRVVAVKRLPNAEKGTQGEEEFRAELSVIGRIYHMNLVRMWGFCVQSSKRILIYEYVENGSLDKFLFQSQSENHIDVNSSSTVSNTDSETPFTSTSSVSLRPRDNVLDWSRRFGIALGMARGLAYLHHECLDWIIHCDIKPENILLDADYNPKIADFGLVKLTQRDSPGSHLSKIRGTKGYMAPEWTSNIPITAKVDVYSYGIILLELLRGARLSTLGVVHPVMPNHHDATGKPLELRALVQLLKQGLLGGPEPHLGEDQGEPLPFSVIIEEFLDPRLNGIFNPRQASVLLQVALSCLEEDRHKRPSMDYVVQLLINCCEAGSTSAKFHW